MAELVGPILDVLSERVRDPQCTATSRDQMRLILSWAQRLVNAKNETIIETATVTTNPQRILYTFEAHLPNAIRIKSIRQDDRDLPRVELRALKGVDTKWFRQVGAHFDEWCMVGRDAFIVVPVVDKQVDLSVRYVKLLDALTSDAQELELRVDEVSEMLILAEIFVNLRRRNMPLVTAALQALMK